MFKRISYDDWHTSVPIIAFVLTFGVFIFFVVRALRLRGDEADRLASLPLDSDDVTTGEVHDA